MEPKNIVCSSCGKSFEGAEGETRCPSCKAAAVTPADRTEPVSGGEPATSEATEPYPRNEAPAPADVLKEGDELGGYRVERLLGRGGMGAVYLATQLSLGRKVALKVLAERFSSDEAFVQRFEREALALANLNHPNIVSIIDKGRLKDRYYFVMEYVDGVSLRQVLAQKKFSPEQALKIVPVLCQALEYAHGQGIVHRDIKPENILVAKSGHVKIADFGLVRILQGDKPDTPPLTRTEQVMGTRDYMAPEARMSAKNADHRSDIYSLGVVIYEMLTGELPIGKFAPPSQKVEVDVRLDEVVLKTLDADPERRYQRASEVGTDVTRITGTAAEAGPAPADAKPPAAKAKDDSGKKVLVGRDGINVQSGKDKIHIGSDGIHVEDGEDKIHIASGPVDRVRIGLGGIHVQEGGKEVHIGLGGVHAKDGARAVHVSLWPIWLTLGAVALLGIALCVGLVALGVSLAVAVPAVTAPLLALVLFLRIGKRTLRRIGVGDGQRRALNAVVILAMLMAFLALWRDRDALLIGKLRMVGDALGKCRTPDGSYPTALEDLFAKGVISERSLGDYTYFYHPFEQGDFKGASREPLLFASVSYGRKGIFDLDKSGALTFVPEGTPLYEMAQGIGQRYATLKPPIVTWDERLRAIPVYWLSMPDWALVLPIVAVLTLLWMTWSTQSAAFGLLGSFVLGPSLYWTALAIRSSWNREVTEWQVFAKAFADASLAQWLIIPACVFACVWLTRYLRTRSQDA